MGILSNLTNEDQANPARYGILKSQKNEVLRVLQVLGFNKQDFEWEYRSSNVMQNLETEVLLHKESNYYFHFDFRPDTQQWWAFYSPGKDVPVGKQQSNSWQAQLEVFAWWRVYLRRELSAPDLWASLSEKQLLIEAIENSSSGNTRFSEDELTSIRNILNEIRVTLSRTYQIAGATADLVNRRLDDVQEASERLGRKDWFLYALGVATTIAYDIARSVLAEPDLPGQVFTAFLNGLFRLLSGPPVLLQ